PAHFVGDAGRLAYDSFRHVTFFGPWSEGFPGVYFWNWDGLAWSNQIPGFGIFVPLNGEMVFDSYRRRMVYFGGNAGAIAKNTLELWDGTSWSALPDPITTSLFSGSDFPDLAGLIAKLAAQATPISKFLWSQFSAPTQQVLTDSNSTTVQQLDALGRDLNQVLRSVSLYDVKRFAGIKLSPETLTMLSLN